MIRRNALALSSEVREELLRVGNSRTEAASSVQRAKILLLYGDGKRISDIVRDMGITRPLAERCIDKALTFDTAPGSSGFAAVRPSHTHWR